MVPTVTGVKASLAEDPEHVGATGEYPPPKPNRRQPRPTRRDNGNHPQPRRHRHHGDRLAEHDGLCVRLLGKTPLMPNRPGRPQPRHPRSEHPATALQACLQTEWAGRTLTRVPESMTTRVCSNCEAVKDEFAPDLVYLYGTCGHEAGQDENSTRNTLTSIGPEPTRPSAEHLMELSPPEGCTRVGTHRPTETNAHS